jgi:hypothetical protein
MTPAPRSIDLAKLEAISKSGGQENNPAGVILESGLVTNQPASLGSEQQVAFSVWALGKTGLIASAASPQRISAPQPKAEDSSPPAVDSATNIPSAQPSGSLTPQSELSKTIVPTKEASKESAVEVHATARERESRNPGDGQTVTSGSNAPPSDNAKPVELVFVTNAPSPPAPVAETAAKESAPVATQKPASTAPAASSLPDVPNDHEQILAHARASDPAEEKRELGPALVAPSRGFLRDNINPLALMIVAGFGAAYCFRMWLRTNARLRGVSVSLAQETEEDSSQSDAAERIFVRRR